MRNKRIVQFINDYTLFPHTRHLPWYRRYEFVIGSFLFLIIFAIFLLPERGKPNLYGIIPLYIFAAFLFSWVANILADREKPIWLQVFAAGLIFVTIGAFLFFYSGADFNDLGSVFFNFEIMEGEWSKLIVGLGMTIRLAIISICFGTAIGLFLAVLRRFNNRILNTIIIAYVNFFRAMPIIVFLLFIYYGLPALNILLDAYTSAILVLSFAAGAVTSEIFRSGIESIHVSQIEAARALGLSSAQTMQYVILPQTFRIVIPPLANSWIGTLKDTAVCSVVALVELLKASQVAMAGKANPTPLIAGTVIYIAIILPLTRFTGYLEFRMKQRKQV